MLISLTALASIVQEERAKLQSEPRLKLGLNMTIEAFNASGTWC